MLFDWEEGTTKHWRGFEGRKNGERREESVYIILPYMQAAEKMSKWSTSRTLEAIVH